MPVLIRNKKAGFDYEIIERLEAGVELYGLEVKSLKLKRGSIVGARVLIRGNEAFIVGFDIPPFQPKNTPKKYESDRTKRLLLKQKEISYLSGKGAQRGLTIVPLSVYTKHRLIKIEIAIVRGRKKYDKREMIKKRDIQRSIRRELRE